MSSKERLEQKREAKVVEEQQAAAQEAQLEKKAEKEGEKEAGKEKPALQKAKQPSPIGEKKEQKREVVLQRNYVVPLREAYAKPATKRASTAAKLLRAFLARHMKSQDVKIDPALSRVITARCMSRPPKSLRVKASKDKQGSVLAQPG